MKRFFYRFGIVVLAFAFSVTVTIFWFKYNPPIESYEEVNFTRIPTVEYCDLRNDPRRYDGKIVRLNTKLNWFMHGYFLSDNNCSGVGDEARTSISFYQPNAEEIGNLINQFREPQKRWETVDMIAVGRFKYESPRNYSDGIEDRTSLHFEIYKIESAKR
jgi:hypothetical protein